MTLNVKFIYQNEAILKENQDIKSILMTGSQTGSAQLIHSKCLRSRSKVKKLEIFENFNYFTDTITKFILKAGSQTGTERFIFF